MQALGAFNVRVGIGQHIEHAATRAHFLHIAFELFQQLIVGRDGYYRHGGIDQRQRAVFELASRVGLGVDVADFFELERPFQRNRVVAAPAQEQGVFALGEVFGPADDLRLQRQHGLQGHGQVAHGG